MSQTRQLAAIIFLIIIRNKNAPAIGALIYIEIFYCFTFKVTLLVSLLP